MLIVAMMMIELIFMLLSCIFRIGTVILIIYFFLSIVYIIIFGLYSFTILILIPVTIILNADLILA